MMMDCPRCGFSQPKDRYCASCGLDVENFVQKPKPLWITVLQDPSFHLSLIGLLIVLVVGYIFYSRSEMVSREVHHFLGKPLSSREAADPDDSAPLVEDRMTTQHEDLRPTAQTTAAPTTVNVQTINPSTAAQEKSEPIARIEPQKVDVGFLEVSREVLAQLIAQAEKVGEGNEGRVYLFKDAAKMNEALKGARRITLNRMANLQNGAQVLVVTPPQSPEAFQFGLSVQVSQWEDKVALLRWQSQLVLAQPETAQEMAAATPTLKAVTETTLAGSASVAATAAVMIVIEPINRHPRDEYLTKAGEGPWSIFSSEDFRAGVSDWVVLIQLK